MTPHPSRPLVTSETSRSNKGRAVRRLASALAVAVVALLVSAGAAVAAPIWNLSIHHNQTNFPPGGSAQYWFEVINVGDQPSSGTVTLTVQLPPGLTRKAVRFNDTFGSYPWSCPGSAGASTVTCTTSAAIARHGQSRDISLVVNVAADAEGELTATAQVEGGGAAAPASASEATRIDPEPAAFGVLPDSWAPDFFEADGITPFRQAGGHPPLGSFVFDLNSVDAPTPDQPEQKLPPENVRNLQVDLPQGFVGDPTAVDECTPAQLSAVECPPSSQVGRFDAIIAPVATFFTFTPFTAGVFNMTHPKGNVADLAFLFRGNPTHIRATLDPKRDYAIQTVVTNINETAPIFSQRLTLWGVPADPSHDSERCPSFHGFGETDQSCPAETNRKPFLTVPTDCTADPAMTIFNYDSWQNTGVFGPPATYDMPGKFTGCEAVQEKFEPSASITPTKKVAATPTGLDVQISVPYHDDPDGVSTPPIRQLRVTLPEGVTVNPSFADGLNGCTEAQIGITHAGVPDEQKVTCPDQSRIGSIELSSPLLPAPLKGSLFLAKQMDNPLNSLFALYAVIHDTEERGVLIKLPGRLDLDPSTGQVTTTFDDLPQFPVENLTVGFRSGDRAPLVNPPTCGTKTITVGVSTWTRPDRVLPLESSYEIESGAGGAPCVNDRAALPFAPKLRAGAHNPLAGSFSPFVFRLTRSDGEQELTGLEAELPPGLSGKLAGVAECPDSVIASIPRTPGTAVAEKANPSCPLASRVGRINAGAGAGPLPYYIPGSVYLAGPYKGAPFSLAIVTPATSGGIDLGNVVTRAALHVDSEDAHIRVVADPIPTVLHGVPIHLRDIRVITDRPEFTINPSSCLEGRVTGMAKGAGSLLGSAADDTASVVSDRFQVGGCSALGFKPKLALSLRGGTRRGDYPALRARLRVRSHDANIKRAVVTLPRSMFLAQEHIVTICTRVQYAADQCPAGSVYGFARASTPLLSEPLAGPVYLRASDNPLPDLVAKLRGRITVNLVGRIDSVRERLRTSFETAPDVPVTSFELAMRGGKKGLIVNSRNLCLRKERAATKFTGHSGAVSITRPVVKEQRCKKKKKRARKTRKGTRR
jgi:hypothetical protein